MSASSNFVRFVRGLRVALFGLPHRHRWETVTEITLVKERDGLPQGRAYDLRCRGCGDIVRRRM